MRKERRLPSEASGRTALEAIEPSSSIAPVRLVVMEDGTNAFEEDALPSGNHAMVIVAQSGGERPTEFANRVIRRIEALEGGHRGIVGTVFLLSPRFDAEATAARVSISRSLMAHSAAARGTSDLLISAGTELHPALQAKVLALADALMKEEAAKNLAIAVQFASDGLASGRHASMTIS